MIWSTFQKQCEKNARYKKRCEKIFWSDFSAKQFKTFLRLILIYTENFSLTSLKTQEQRVPKRNCYPLEHAYNFHSVKITVEPRNSGKIGYPDFLRYCGVFRYFAGYLPHPKNHTKKIFFQYARLCILYFSLNSY